MPSKILVAALGLAPVLSLRQKAALDSNQAVAAHIVQSMSALIHENDFGGVQSLIEELAQQTPGAGDSYKESLTKSIKAIEDEVEQKIKDGQSATQVKIENEIEKYETANEAVDQNKANATQADTSLYKCVEEEKANKEAIEAAQVRLADAQAKEEKACQAQQDARGFSYTPDAQLGYSCDLGVNGDCGGKHNNMVEQMQKLEEAANKELSAERAEYQRLKAACDSAKAATGAAQSALNSAEKDFAAQVTKCRSAKESRDQAVCAFGSASDAKCAEEGQFKATIAATEERNGDMHSEIDRKHEWEAAFTTKCMLGKALAKGLKGVVTADDLVACKGMANYSENVGELKTFADKAQALTNSNACTERKVSFFNGQQWIVPTKPDATSAEYVTEEYKPVFSPGGKGGFAGCVVTQQQ